MCIQRIGTNPVGSDSTGIIAFPVGMATGWSNKVLAGVNASKDSLKTIQLQLKENDKKLPSKVVSTLATAFVTIPETSKEPAVASFPPGPPGVPPMATYAPASYGMSGYTSSYGAAGPCYASDATYGINSNCSNWGSSRNIIGEHPAGTKLSGAYLNEFGPGCIAYGGGFHRRLPDLFLPKWTGCDAAKWERMSFVTVSAKGERMSPLVTEAAKWERMLSFVAESAKWERMLPFVTEAAKWEELNCSLLWQKLLSERDKPGE